MSQLSSLLEQVNKQFRKPSTSYQTKQYANWRIQEIRADFDKATRDNADTDFLLSYIQAECEKFKLSRKDGDKEKTLEESYYDEVRENPVCTCDNKLSHQCPLKRGILPREVRKADSIDDGIRKFRANHNGNPIVLQDAQAEWAELVGRVETELRDILSALSSDEIPPESDWTSSSSSNGQKAD